MVELLTESIFEDTELSKDFGLYIYDLLRCKVEVASLPCLLSMLSKFQDPAGETRNKVCVFRIKNRLDTHNRDVLVNFKYGDRLAAEIQIALKQHIDKKSIQKYTFKHFLYELVRNILGPTMELIILYQDEEDEAEKEQHRVERMFPQGRVRRRNRTVDGIEVSTRCVKYSVIQKCSVKEHELYEVSQKALDSGESIVCSMCSNEVFSKNDRLCLYCHKCSFVYCLNCCGKKLEE